MGEKRQKINLNSLKNFSLNVGMLYNIYNNKVIGITLIDQRRHTLVIVVSIYFLFLNLIGSNQNQQKTQKINQINYMTQSEYLQHLLIEILINCSTNLERFPFFEMQR